MSNANMAQTLIYTGQRIERLERENRKLKKTLEAISGIAFNTEVVEGLKDARYVLKDSELKVVLSPAESKALHDFAIAVQKVVKAQDDD